MGQADTGRLKSELIQSANRALELLRKGDLAGAKDEFSFILQHDYDSSLAEFGIKVTRYLLPRVKHNQTTAEGYKRGVLL